MRRAIVAVLRVVLRIFFRRIEVAGIDNVPHDRPVLFAANHTNALIDPTLLLCFAPRPVSFVAKSPLFRMPVIGWIVRLMDSLPVERRQDEGSDLSKNREVFERARTLLGRGGSLAIFPEGISHDEPALAPFKTGAARIALGAMAGGGAATSAQALCIVPVGLFYSAKATFRSAVLVRFGAPLDVPRLPLDENGEPPRDAVRALTARIEEALRTLVLEASEQRIVDIVTRAERIFSASDEGTDRLALERVLERRRRIAAGYVLMAQRGDTRLAALEARVQRFIGTLAAIGLEPRHLQVNRSRAAAAAQHFMTFLALLIVMPAALLGIVIHYPAYRAIGSIARQTAGDSADMLSTVKLFAAALLLPLTWLLVCGITYAVAGGVVAVRALFVAPILGYLALRFVERLDGWRARVRALFLSIWRKGRLAPLHQEQEVLVKELLALADELGLARSV